MPEVLEHGSTAAQRHDVPLESLKNRISITDMGTRLVRDAYQLPSQKLATAPQAAAESTAFDELLSFVFKYFSDLPDETLNAAAEGLIAIAHDGSLSAESKKTEIEAVLDAPLSNADFNEVHSIAQRIPPRSEAAQPDERDVDIDDLLRDLSEEDRDDNDDANNNLEPWEEPENKPRQLSSDAFVAINRPLRLSSNPFVRPQDVDAHWLEYKLKQTDVHVSVDEILRILANNETSVEAALLSALGIEHVALVQLLLKNSDVVLWYTRLHRAETGVEREALLNEINNRGLSIEALAQKEQDERMEVDVPNIVDLDAVGRPHVVWEVPTVKLPEGSTRFTTKTYEQYNIPAGLVASPEWPLKPVKELPSWAATAFGNIDYLNTVQSRACGPVIETDDNILLCAPTGAGKTNVALLALTRALNHGFKAVYVAPLKALAQEQVRTLQSRLPDRVVAELSGDQGLSRHQLLNTDVLVATPEKWDIVSRKPANARLLRSVGLVIIDEIHLLHDEHRGSVLENIVARHNRSLFPPRLVGLSATLPNYQDVGRFLRVPPSGLLFFDARFRPVPLEQKYVGVTTKSPLKLMRAINEACIEKVREALNEGKQILVFVHSRKDTQSTAQLLLNDEQIGSILNEGQVAIHHAGLNRTDRAQAEAGFRDRKIKVLVCTATLAWGVNLPAAVVIIKGTQYYDPSHDGWRQLQPQDILQMLGRAGRPGFDASGLGVILTEHKHLSYFASVATLALPIQSHLVNRLLDSLNAEITLGTVLSLDEAVEWLKHTFWFVRSSEEPQMYGLDDSSTIRDVAHSALTELAKLNVAVYDYPTVASTFQGQVAADFYVSPVSINLYCQRLKPWLTEIDILRTFCLSAEFESLPVRRGEEAEISRLANLVPIPVRDESSSRVAKVCVLLQAYVCRLQLEGLALSADMVYIAQSASRLFRAIFQLAVAQNWSRLTQLALRIFLAVDKRQWYAGQTPFRQFPHCPIELIKRAEASQLPWKRYFDLDSADIGEVLRLHDPQVSEIAAHYLAWFPRFSISAKSRPIARTIIRVDVELSPLFEFDKEVHAATDQFYLMTEDQHGTLLDWRVLTMHELTRPLSKQVFVFLQSDIYPQYIFVRLLSDKWIHSESSTAVNLRSLLPPAKFSAPLSLTFDEESYLVSSPSGAEEEQRGLLERALSPLLGSTDRSTYIGLPPGSQKTGLQEIVVSRACDMGVKVLFITPRSSHWLGISQNSQVSVSLNLETDADLFVVNAIEVERLSRTEDRFKRLFSKFGVVLCDDIHLIGDHAGSNTTHAALYELAVTRIVNGLPDVRIIGFGPTIATARAVGQWIGAQKNDVANIAFSDGLDGPLIEVRHWDGSFMLALRSINLLQGVDMPSSSRIGLLLVVGNTAQCTYLAEELEAMGLSEVPVLSNLASAKNIEEASGEPVVVATLDLVLGVGKLQAEKVVLCGTEWRGDEVAVVDVLDLVSKAHKEVTVLTNKQQYYAAFVTEPLPLESALVSYYTDSLVSGIANGKISEPQDAVDWLSSTYLYRRLRQNPSYYGSGDLEEWISDLVETAFERLASIGAVDLREEDLVVKPLALAHISNYHGVSVEALVDPKVRVDIKDWSAHRLENLQCMWLLDARIDLAVARAQLAPLFAAVDARQSLIQTVPVGASPLLQIPYIDERAALKCQDVGITSVQEFVAIEEDDLRSAILGFGNDDPRMLEVAEFVNHYPIVDVVGARISGEMAVVQIERDIDEEEDEITVVARGLPAELAQNETWYVVVGDPQTKMVFGCRKVRIASRELQIEVPLSGTSANMTAWLMCDSYIDADKECEVGTL